MRSISSMTSIARTLAPPNRGRPANTLQCVERRRVPSRNRRDSLLMCITCEVSPRSHDLGSAQAAKRPTRPTIVCVQIDQHQHARHASFGSAEQFTFESRSRIRFAARAGARERARTVTTPSFTRHMISDCIPDQHAGRRANENMKGRRD